MRIFIYTSMERRKKGSDLVILDAKDLKELAVYELPISIPHGLHGSWVN